MSKHSRHPKAIFAPMPDKLELCEIKSDDIANRSDCRQFEVPTEINALFSRLNYDNPQHAEAMAIRGDKYDIPPFLRKPPRDSLSWTLSSLDAIDRRIVWLAERKLRPHQNVIEKRDRLLEKLRQFAQNAGPDNPYGSEIAKYLSDVP